MSSLHQVAIPRVISATTLRTKTRDILEEARFGGEHFIVETFGKPMAVIMGVEQYWELINDPRDPDGPHPQPGGGAR